MVRNCIGDEERCGKKIKEGSEALDQVKEEHSQHSEIQEESSEGDMSDGDVESFAASMEKVKVKIEPSAPELPLPPPYACNGAGGNSLHPETWKELEAQCFPVFQNQQGNRYHEPLDWKIVQRLAEAVRAYGANAAFVVTQLESLHRYCMTPSDWQNLARACLTTGQYLDWKVFYLEFATRQAALNAHNGQATWDQDMLMGQGRFAAAQTNYPVQVYDQINALGVRAWKSLPNRGEVGGNLTKILQGPTEPFSDFVGRIMEAGGRVFGDADTAIPLLKQLIFEQCTKECRHAITPYKSKGLEVWMKVCRELGGPLTNAGLVAAVMQMSQGKFSPKTGNCFACG